MLPKLKVAGLIPVARSKNTFSESTMHRVERAECENGNPRGQWSRKTRSEKCRLHTPTCGPNCRKAHRG
jgi:hypothetical protein